MNVIPFNRRPGDDFEERLDQLETAFSFVADNVLPRMTFTKQTIALEERLGTIESFLDFNPSAPADDALPDSIHDLIAEGMTGVTTDFEARLDRLTGRIDDIQDLLLKAVLKGDALESKTPC